MRLVIIFLLVAWPALALAVPPPETANTAAPPAAATAVPVPVTPPVTYEDYREAVLRGVDKITGRVALFEVGLDEATRFGTLYVTVRACQKTPPEETPEAAAFLEIDEIKPGVTAKRWFSGWMFASSPAIAPLQHPVYDIWVVDCKLKVPQPVAAGANTPAGAGAAIATESLAE